MDIQQLVNAVATALTEAFNMAWEVFWPLILGFALSGAVQAVVSHKSMARLLGDDSPSSLTFATLFGAASSSCSYAAVALARSLFLKGASFVCSVGNVPLAAVLWQGGISFGGVVSFIFADLIVLPIVDIYRKYYGGRVALYILGTFYATMAAAGYLVEVLFGTFGISPTQRNIVVFTEGPSLNYTSVLNLVFLALAVILVWRFLRTGGPAMLRMMNAPQHAGEHRHKNQPASHTIA